MFIQPIPSSTHPRTERTGPATAVPGAIRGRVAVVGLLARPADQVLRDVAVGILLADNLVDLVTVQGRSHAAAATLQVVGQAGGGGEAVAAEGAVDVLATVDAGVEML